MKHIFRKFIENLNKRLPYPIFYKFEMSPLEKAVFDEAILSSKSYLEFGMGGSTLRALQKSQTIIYSVESSPEWISHMKEYAIIGNNLNKRLYISAVDIGPTREWGIPVTNENQHLFPAYSSNIFGQIDKDALDLALIDGRFRVACILKMILEFPNNNKLKIMIHDFWNREEYHIVLKYLDKIKQADSLGMFRIRSRVDLGAVEKDYHHYKYVSE